MNLNRRGFMRVAGGLAAALSLDRSSLGRIMASRNAPRSWIANDDLRPTKTAPVPADNCGGFVIPPEFVPALLHSFENPGVPLWGKPIVRQIGPPLSMEQVCKARGVPYP